MRASEALASGGLTALRQWLDANKDAVAQRDLFILGPDGRDILGRRLSEPAARRWEFVSRDARLDMRPRPPFPMPPANFWPAHQVPQIFAADGSIYTILLVPRRPGLFGALSLPGIPIAVLALALLVSALASGWLARHFSAPIRRMQEGARSVASDHLDLRVSAGLDGRKDELAVLARDFDAMADQLRAARSARTQLLRDISHELRSPLSRMRVALGLARQSASDMPRQLDRMELEIERLDSLISQILKLARLRASDVTIEKEIFDLDEVVEDVVNDGRFEGVGKNCAVELCGRSHAQVLGHRELLRSAVENVVRNAVRYSPPGEPVDVSVSLEAGRVWIRISDRGPGVPSIALQRIFEPFYRVAESRDRDSGGEGIGLAITAQVMRAHGGRATAENGVAGGLRVILSLPIADASTYDA